ncbi:uncharacterized protein K489DRAFT_375354 [Dissoconium aciculare CBS 342.82]|jgi:60S ribosomal subunit assembly/export protein LOC1|uniref:60S ribosomal subunit assembly/export protein LOC1 n=1 Tax=Dissoconium aciculare CBS 342.82 TaxID=1314786 RepID=A0A6J3MH47_9PEZI|nr:uncharacterized protein K489DRAFT_375354 [Dissoconium aciculare CBS 342.82]KAF1827265.1 hypothetical protein K489DRAFT_375354 [Dissoconium aciculare CBS 342.82]
MALPSKSGANKGTSKSSKSFKSGGASKGAKKTGPKPAATQHKPKPNLLNDKKKTLGKRKPPHLRYTEAELKVPQLNGIRPAGVQKPPNAKKGKNFVDDKESMNAIMALVMAEKEGNIESKMMRARQMEEVREARRLEMEKRAEGKREGLEERKQNIKNGSKKRRRSESEVEVTKDKSEDAERSQNSKRKRVSFG